MDNEGLQKAVANFGDAMLNKLNENIKKGGWEHMSIQELYCYLLDEVGELGDALRTGGYSGYMPDEAVDVANFAMMIFDNLMNTRDDTPMVFPEEEVIYEKDIREHNEPLRGDG